jgi:site-specific recombinase XerD
LPAWAQRNIVNLSEARRQTALRFLRDLRLQGFSQQTVISYIQTFRVLGSNGKPYEELTAEDLAVWMEKTSSNGWSVNTVNMTRKNAKRFLRWVHGCKSSKDPTPEPLKVIRKLTMRRELPRQIFSREEIKRLLDACDNQRDRAMLFVAYESGARLGEILGMKVGDAEFDQFGAKIHISGKTGARIIRLIESVPDFRLWLSMHPQKTDPQAPVWTSLKRKGEPIGDMGFQMVLQRLQKRAGITKHIHPHLIRHTRATHLATVLTEAQMRMFFGWTKRSDMPEVYVHLSGRDVDATLLKHYGIELEAPTESALEPKTCAWCRAANSPSAKFCQGCNAPLDPASAQRAAENQKKKMEFMDRILERLHQEAPSVLDNIFRESKKEMAELATMSHEE